MNNNGKIYKNGMDLNYRLLEFINKSSNLSIYVPYIKLNQLRYLISKSYQVDKIVVRWELNDLIRGASDIEVYPFLKERSIKLYRNPRIHLKAFVDCYESAFIGSANISQRALNVPDTHNHNYELGTIVENLTVSDRLYFQTIEAESLLITDKIFKELQQQVCRQREKNKEIDYSLDFDLKEIKRDFLISSLPMTDSVDSLKKIYFDSTNIDEIQLNCALHDLAIFRIPLGLDEKEFMLKIKWAFFNSPFIREFLKNLDIHGEIFFGRAKNWIQSNCLDSPIPRKWEITTNIQILFKWIVDLSDGKYIVDRPNYSERLKFIDK